MLNPSPLLLLVYAVDLSHLVPGGPDDKYWASASPSAGLPVCARRLDDGPRHQIAPSSFACVDFLRDLEGSLGFAPSEATCLRMLDAAEYLLPANILKTTPGSCILVRLIYITDGDGSDWVLASASIGKAGASVDVREEDGARSCAVLFMLPLGMPDPTSVHSWPRTYPSCSLLSVISHTLHSQLSLQISSRRSTRAAAGPFPTVQFGVDEAPCSNAML